MLACALLACAHFSLYFFPSLFNSVLSTSVLLKHFLMHEKTNALNSSGADAHEKGEIYFIVLLSFSVRGKISRQAAIAFNGSAPGPAHEIPSVRTRTYFLFAEMKTQGIPYGSLLGRCRCQYQFLFLFLFVEDILC